MQEDAGAGDDQTVALEAGRQPEDAGGPARGWEKSQWADMLQNRWNRLNTVQLYFE